MNQNLILKNQIAEIQSKTDAEKQWWENRKAGAMKDLGVDGTPVEVAPRKTGSSDSDDAVLVETGGPAQDQGAKKRKGKKAGAT